MKVVFHETFHEVYASDPAAAGGRLEAVVDVIQAAAEWVSPGPASEADILAVHSRSHVERVKREGVYPVAALAAGGAIKTATLALGEPVFGLIRPPGHHASRDSAWGFCYFNNMAIAVERLKRDGLINRAHVLDVDLHFGDGTVNILGNRDDVTVTNVSAPRRDEYLSRVTDEMDRCEADLIGISAGFDNHEDDWGGLLTTDDYRSIGQLVRAAAQRNSGGSFAVLEGGYNHQVLGRNVMALMEGLAGTP